MGTAGCGCLLVCFHIPLLQIIIVACTFLQTTFYKVWQATDGRRNINMSLFFAIVYKDIHMHLWVCILCVNLFFIAFFINTCDYSYFAYLHYLMDLIYMHRPCLIFLHYQTITDWYLIENVNSSLHHLKSHSYCDLWLIVGVKELYTESAQQLNSLLICIYVWILFCILDRIFI